MSARSESSSPAADAGPASCSPLAVGLGFLTASWGALHLPPFDRYQIIDTPVYQEYGEAMAAGEVPYRDFALEYPPGALPVFWLPTLGPAEHYRSLFELLMWLCAAATARPRRARGRGARRPARRGCSPPRSRSGSSRSRSGTVVLTRYDLWPALLTAAALAAVLAGRERLGLAVLGVAVAAKIYPLVAPAAAARLRRAPPRPAGGGDRARRLRGGARRDRRAVRADRARGPRRLGRAPARPPAPDREPRRLAPPRGEAARPLRPGRRLLARLAEPGRAAPRRPRDASRPCCRRWRWSPSGSCSRAGPATPRAPGRRLRRVGRRLRRLRQGALAAVPDLARPGRAAASAGRSASPPASSSARRS